jgi:hypothetical protein
MAYVDRQLHGYYIITAYKLTVGSSGAWLRSRCGCCELIADNCCALYSINARVARGS